MSGPTIDPATSAVSKRVAIYSHDTFGLGNIRRMVAVAEHLIGQDPELHVLVITGSPMTQAFRISSRIDFVKLPCLSRDALGGYGTRSLPLNNRQLFAMRSDLIRATLENYRPDLILVDKKPLGVEGELEAALDRLATAPRPPALILLLRDILDAPETTRAVWARHGYHEVISQHYDLVLVAGQPEVFDLAAAYGFPDSTRRRLRYCGYIRRADLPAVPMPPEPGRVLVTAGGGGDGFPLLHAFLAGLRQTRPAGLRRSLVITGPEMDNRQRNHLASLARGLQTATLLEFCPDMAQETARAQVVVCMGGYNTLCEMLAMGKRVICAPRVQPVREQWLRARLLADRGLLSCIEPARLGPRHLMQALGAALSQRSCPRTTARLDFNGLDRIGYWTLRLLSERRPRVTAPPIHIELPQRACHASVGA